MGCSWRSPCLLGRTFPPIRLFGISLVSWRMRFVIGRLKWNCIQMNNWYSLSNRLMNEEMKCKLYTKEPRMRLPEYAQHRISSDAYLPLELSKDLHICMWSEDESYKWTIAYFDHTKDGPFIRSVGERILDVSVNWDQFHELIRLGFSIAWHNFNAAELKD